MALLTEEDVRRMSNQGTRGPVVVNRDQDAHAGGAGLCCGSTG